MKARIVLAAVLAMLPSIAATQGWMANAGKPELVIGQRIPVTPAIVKDGDTVQVREFRHDIRLASIDSPELGHGRHKPGQAFAQASRKALIDLVSDGRRIEAFCYERDRYERPVCDLYADGRSVSRALVASGMAWANQAAGGRYLRDKQLVLLQAQAQVRKEGLWADPAPMEPWVWRDACWKDGRCEAH